MGLARDRRMVENLRDRGVVLRPEDLQIDPRQATRDLLAEFRLGAGDFFFVNRREEAAADAQIKAIRAELQALAGPA